MALFSLLSFDPQTGASNVVSLLIRYSGAQEFVVRVDEFIRRTLCPGLDSNSSHTESASCLSLYLSLLPPSPPFPFPAYSPSRSPSRCHSVVPRCALILSPYGVSRASRPLHSLLRG